MYSFSLIVLGVFLLYGCQSTPRYNQTEQLNKTHYQDFFISKDGLPITLWLTRQSKVSNSVRVYIEGDGRAWLRRNRVSADPTPRNRLVHGLMIKDEKVDTAYIARPCQYEKNEQCSADLWTFSRYSSPSVEAIQQALSFIKSSKNYRTIELVGFSGGATIALILAAQRQDVRSVRTVAGNLDPDYINTFHNVSAMPTALHPSDFSYQLQSIPQWHFLGQLDAIVPLSVYDHYLFNFKNKSCIKKKVVQNAGHHNGWVNQWALLLELPPSCTTL